MSGIIQAWIFTDKIDGTSNYQKQVWLSLWAWFFTKDLKIKWNISYFISPNQEVWTRIYSKIVWHIETTYEETKTNSWGEKLVLELDISKILSFI